MTARPHLWCIRHVPGMAAHPDAMGGVTPVSTCCGSSPACSRPVSACSAAARSSPAGAKACSCTSTAWPMSALLTRLTWLWLLYVSMSVGTSCTLMAYASTASPIVMVKVPTRAVCMSMRSCGCARSCAAPPKYSWLERRAVWHRGGSSDGASHDAFLQKQCGRARAAQAMHDRRLGSVQFIAQGGAARQSPRGSGAAHLRGRAAVRQKGTAPR